MSDYAVDFRVYPSIRNPFLSPDGTYFRARVFSCRDQMWTAGKALDVPGGDYEAIVIPKHRYSYRGGTEKLMPKIGDILFHSGNIGTTVISHESVHAATTYLRIHELLSLSSDGIDDSEELLAHCVCQINRQISSKLWRSGFYASESWRAARIPA